MRVATARNSSRVWRPLRLNHLVPKSPILIQSPLWGDRRGGVIPLAYAAPNKLAGSNPIERLVSVLLRGWLVPPRFNMLSLNGDGNEVE
jgi:hypothetical protein